jgi:hypothetical protein
MKENINDNIYHARKFIHELSKVQDLYYNKIKKKFKKSEEYKLKNIRDSYKAFTGKPFTIIRDDDQLEDFFWDYMFNIGYGDTGGDFFEHIMDIQLKHDEHKKSIYSRE